MLAYSSPKLIAVNRVLLRLLAPRHPPYALNILTCVIPKACFRFHCILTFLLIYLFCVFFFFLCAVFKELSQKLLGGDEENRTPDPLLARQVLSQLSYTPTNSLARARISSHFHQPIPKKLKALVGLGGLEPPTSRLSGVRSNQLSYRPSFPLSGLSLWKLNSEQSLNRP